MCEPPYREGHATPSLDDSIYVHSVMCSVRLFSLKLKLAKITCVLLSGTAALPFDQLAKPVPLDKPRQNRMREQDAAESFNYAH